MVYNQARSSPLAVKNPAAGVPGNLFQKNIIFWHFFDGKIEREKTSTPEVGWPRLWATWNSQLRVRKRTCRNHIFWCRHETPISSSLAQHALGPQWRRPSDLNGSSIGLHGLPWAFTRPMWPLISRADVHWRRHPGPVEDNRDMLEGWWTFLGHVLRDDMTVPKE